MKCHKFNRAHFPVGTLFMCETVASGTHEVTGVSCNGPDSWVVETKTPEPAFTHGGFKSINIDWIDTIVKRGTGRVRILSHRRLEGYNPRVGMLSAYTGSWSSMVSSMLLNHPAYRDDACDHLYDYQLVIDALMHHFGERYYVGVINKKKFHKVFKAALTKAKTNRRKAQLEDQRQDMETYQEDMGLDDMNFGSDDDGEDESEDHQGDDPFPIVPQSYTDQLSGSAEWDAVPPSKSTVFGTDRHLDHLDSSEID